MEDRPAFPVRLEGRLDPQLSRWLWLVKWLLAIPHFIVLFFLWIAFVVLTIVAFFAILFTGRYPRGIFEFNVGVLRWTWRVSYYSYGALGTDRYPPFTLDEQPDYPATLAVAYPERLSRGLVLVKWWLLAIPQYILVGIFVGGAGSAAGEAQDQGGWHWWYGGGLIGILVLFAGIALLFTARYPRGLFDFVLGLDRWVVRVAAYVFLMTDSYPPFRLDQGEDDPAGAAAMAPEAVSGGGSPGSAFAGCRDHCGGARAAPARRSWTRRPHRRGSHRGAALAADARRGYGPRRGRSGPARRRRLPDVPERGLLQRGVRHRLR